MGMAHGAAQGGGGRRRRGRRHAAINEINMTPFIDVVLVLLNSAAETAKEAADQLRRQRKRVGVVSLTVLRPFPDGELREALRKAKVVVIADRADSFGGYGPLFMEIAPAVYPYRPGPLIFNKIYGLGGRDLMPLDVDQVLDETSEVAKTGKVKMVKEYITVRN